MRDLPGIFWILVLTFVSGTGLFIYARVGPSPVPSAETVWGHVEGLRQNLEYRRVNLEVGTQRESVAPPYRSHHLALPCHAGRNWSCPCLIDRRGHLLS